MKIKNKYSIGDTVWDTHLQQESRSSPIICPNCGGEKIARFSNNTPVACEVCKGTGVLSSMLITTRCVRGPHIITKINAFESIDEPSEESYTLDTKGYWQDDDGLFASEAEAQLSIDGRKHGI